MPAAILIGFEYRILTIEPNGRSSISLNFPGTFIDLNTVNLFCREQKWDTTIVTDIIEEQFPEGIVNKVTTGAVDSKSLVFYTKYNKDFRLVKDKKDFVGVLTEELQRIKKSGEKHIFVYYTGHGVNNDEGKSSILLPNAQHISFDKLRNIITSNLKSTEIQSDCEVMIVLDCCYPNNMGLPYTLKEYYQQKENIIAEISGAKENQQKENIIAEISGAKENKVSTKVVHKWVLADEYLASQHKILLITSATRYQTSAATKFGSLFTEYFFSYLRELNKPLSENKKEIEWPSRNLMTIANKVSADVKARRKDEQNISIYSAYKIPTTIPYWVGGLQSKITIDHKSGLIFIKDL
jgi:hypothetical protein